LNFRSLKDFGSLQRFRLLKNLAGSAFRLRIVFWNAEALHSARGETMADHSLSEKSIFEAAIEKGSLGERALYLDQACGADQRLRAEVEALLAAHDRLASIPLPATPESADTLDDAITGRPGATVGAYKLKELIGEGGMGLVYVAEQQQPVRRRVALKIIKPGMDSQQVIARFEAERQALALMDHPNIAKVLDGGTTDQSSRHTPCAVASDGTRSVPTTMGRPYFVMELVKGVPITEYCDQSHLSVRERLELFLEVCNAVQHAHQKGIIHRDIKPSNVLVASHDGKPVVKVIDFGVAKAIGQQLTDKTIYTQLAQLIGTPLYMSPEQARESSLDIDTRTDIYSLGVLLYELLTGTTPFAKERFQQVGYDEMRRIIREEEPPKPSTRMSTVGAAATTASANRKSDPRRLSQLFRGELDWIVMKALEKDRNRRYESAHSLALDLQRYLNDEPVLACPPSAWYLFRKFARRNKARLATAGLTLLFLLLLGGGVGWIARDKAARQAKIAGEINQALQEAREREAQGRWSEARAALERARALAAGSADVSRLRRRADELGQDLAMAMKLETLLLQPSDTTEVDRRGAQEERDFAEAFRDYGIDVEELTPEQAAERIRARSIRVEIATALEDWAILRKVQLKTEESAWKRLLAIARAADPDEQRNRFRDALAADDTKALEELAASDNVTALPASTLSFLGLLVANKKMAPQKGVDLLRRAQRRYPDDFWINTGLARLLIRLEPKQVDEAIRFYTTAVAIRPHSPMAHLNLSITLREKGLLDEALAACREADRLDPRSAAVHTLRGEILKMMGRREEAIAACQEAIRLRADFLPPHYRLGVIFHEMGRRDEALAEFQKAVDIDPRNAAAHGQLGVVLAEKGLLDEAIKAYKRSLDCDPNYAESHYNLGLAYAKKKDFDQAIVEYRTAIANRPNFFKAHNNLGGVLLKAKGDLDGAIAAFREVIRLQPDFAAAYRNLGVALEEKGRHGPAADAYREHTRRHPDDARGYFRLGAALAKLGSLDEALAAFQMAICLKPDDAEAHAALGDVLRNKAELDDAITCYREAIRLDPKLASAYTGLGNALTDKARRRRSSLDEAIAVHRKAVELDRNNAIIQYNLGVALADNGSRDEAVAEYRKAVRLKPDYPEAWHNLGYNLKKKGLLDEAIVAFKEAIRYRPGAAESHALLGEALAEKGLLVEAVTAFKDALRYRPNYPWAYNSLGMALLRLGRPGEAIAAFKSAIRHWPEYALAHYGLGLALATKGDREGAIFAYRTAIHLQPNFVEAHDRLGNELLEKGAHDEAVVHCREAVRLAPDLAAARYTLGRALYGKGTHDEAIAHYREAIRLNPGFAEAHCNLADLLLRQGKFTEALAAMKRGHELGSRTPGWRYPSAQWVRDYQRLVDLDIRLSDIRQGKAKPKDEAEQLALARFCLEHKQLYDLSARWYAEAFAARPELVEDLGTAYRFHAARAAARAARGQGPDAAPLDDKGRARWRQKALDWLRADLALWNKRLGDNQPGTGVAARHMLRRWQTDSDLASLRDDVALANLPAAEAEVYRKLWGDVRALLSRLEGGK
jgi:tetratricopeptide (TPR) repeat protein